MSGCVVPLTLSLSKGKRPRLRHEGDQYGTRPYRNTGNAAQERPGLPAI